MEASPELGQPPEGSALRVGLALLVVVGTPAGMWLWQRRVRAAYLLLQRVCCCNIFAAATPAAATAAAAEDGALDNGPPPMANKSITARLCFDTEPQVCTTANNSLTRPFTHQRTHSLAG
eukprot:COSAG01_NODE_26386_length_715_cov_2.469156_1_plen_119_part_10